MNPDGGGRVGGHPLSSDAKKKRRPQPTQAHRCDNRSRSAAGRFRNITSPVDLLCFVMMLDDVEMDE